MDDAGTGDERSRVGSAGGLTSFEAWYRGEYPNMVRVLTLVSGDAEIAADAAAEAFTRALANWDRVAAMASPAGWAYTVALNVLRRRQQRARIEQLIARREPPPPPVPEDRLYLWEAVRSLPPRQRTAIVLHYVADMPQDQVAKVMGVAPGTVAATLHAARDSLRDKLNGSDSDGTDRP